jgi:hypothetical protein
MEWLSCMDFHADEMISQYTKIPTKIKEGEINKSGGR